MSVHRLLFWTLLFLLPHLEGAEIPKIHFRPSQPKESIRERCVSWLAELHRELSQYNLKAPPEIYVYLAPTEADFLHYVQHRSGWTPPQWVLAIAFPGAQEVVIPLSRISIWGNTLRSAFRHEVTHIYLFSLAKRGLPKYWQEGLCTYLSRPLFSPEQLRTLKKLAQMERLIPLSQLRKTFPPHSHQISLAYLQSHHFIHYFVQTYGIKRMASIFATVQQGYSFDYSLKVHLGKSERELEIEWHQSLTQGRLWSWLAWWDDSTFFGLLALLVIVGVVKNYWRNQRIRRKWQEEEPWLWED